MVYRTSSTVQSSEGGAEEPHYISRLTRLRNNNRGYLSGPALPAFLHLTVGA